MAGIQHGLAEEGYKMADGRYAVLSTIGLLGWRVELQHKEPTKTVEFLHVLQAGAGPRGAVADATLTSTRQTHRVAVKHKGRTFELTLRRTGTRGGSIRVNGTRPGTMLCEATLPESIEDHWLHYRDDPNFRTWVTDPRYRVVIEPTEKDRAAVEGRGRP